MMPYYSIVSNLVHPTYAKKKYAFAWHSCLYNFLLCCAKHESKLDHGLEDFFLELCSNEYNSSETVLWGKDFPSRLLPAPSFPVYRPLGEGGTE